MLTAKRRRIRSDANPTPERVATLKTIGRISASQAVTTKVDGKEDCEISSAIVPWFGPRMMHILTGPPPSKLTLSHLASHKYLACNNAIYNNMFLDTKERFTPANLAVYASHLMEMLQYYEDWKMSHLSRAGSRVDEFLAHQTYAHLRQAVNGFLYFCEEMFMRQLPNLQFISVVLSTTTSIEGSFAVARSTGHDYGHNYATGQTNQHQKSVLASAVAATANSDQYDMDSIATENVTGVMCVATSVVKNEEKRRDADVDKWKRMWEPPSSDAVLGPEPAPASILRFGCNYDSLCAPPAAPSTMPTRMLTSVDSDDLDGIRVSDTNGACWDDCQESIDSAALGHLIKSISADIPKSALIEITNETSSLRFKELVFNMGSFQRFLRLSIDGRKDVRVWFDKIAEVSTRFCFEYIYARRGILLLTYVPSFLVPSYTG